MAKEEPSNQLNLTVVALVALVAIVGLVALVMNAASIKNVPRIATGSQVVSADEQNVAGQGGRSESGKVFQAKQKDLQGMNWEGSGTATWRVNSCPPGYTACNGFCYSAYDSRNTCNGGGSSGGSSGGTKDACSDCLAKNNNNQNACKTYCG